MDSLNGILAEDNLPQLIEAELIALRLYTGPRSMKYIAVLRAKCVPNPMFERAFDSLCMGNLYTTTIQVESSGLIKLSTMTKATKVYRGIGGGKLPEAFLYPDKYNVSGGVEGAFLSTTPNRDVAVFYAGGAGGGSKAGVVLKMQQGLTDCGADLSPFSQYGHEKEICWPPLCAMHLTETGVEGNVINAAVRPSVNMKAQTIEKVLASRQQSILDM